MPFDALYQLNNHRRDSYDAFEATSTTPSTSSSSDGQLHPLARLSTAVIVPEHDTPCSSGHAPHELGCATAS